MKADLNNDGVVDLYDLSILLSKWGTSDAVADLNSDGKVDALDLSILLDAWGSAGWYNGMVPDVIVQPSDSNATAQNKINNAGPGSVVGFESGVHLERSVHGGTVWKGTANQWFIGRSDGSTKWDGSRNLGKTGWSGSGPWTIKVNINSRVKAGTESIDSTYNTTDINGNLQPFYGTEADQYPEDLWVRQGTTGTGQYEGAGGWRRLKRTINYTGRSYIDVATPGPGQWRLDYNTSTGSADGVVTIGDDPATFDEIRIGVTPIAVEGRGQSGMKFGDLWIDKYATGMRDSPLGGQPVHHKFWEYYYVTVSGAHSSGFSVSRGEKIYNCLARHNGRYGLSGNDYGDLVQTSDPGTTIPASGVHWEIKDSRLQRNLLLDYNGGHGGGGCKLGAESDESRTNPNLFVNNWVDYNNHHGVWPDHAFEWNPGRSVTQFKSNLVEHNASRGFFIEIWDTADVLVRHNRFYRNGIGDAPGNLYGPKGINEAYRNVASPNVRFVDNQLVNNQRGIIISDANRTNNINKNGDKPRLGNCKVERNIVHIGSVGHSIGSDGRLNRFQTSYGTDHSALNSTTCDYNKYFTPSQQSDDFRYDGKFKAGNFSDWQAINRSTTKLDPNGSITTGQNESSLPTPANWVPFVKKFYGAGSGFDNG